MGGVLQGTLLIWGVSTMGPGWRGLQASSTPVGSICPGFLWPMALWQQPQSYFLLIWYYACKEIGSVWAAAPVRQLGPAASSCGDVCFG